MMPKLAACMRLWLQGWRSGRQVGGGKRLGVGRGSDARWELEEGRRGKGWIEDRQDEDGRCF